MQNAVFQTEEVSSLLTRVTTRTMTPEVAVPDEDDHRSGVRRRRCRTTKVPEEAKLWPMQGFAPMTKIRTLFGAAPAAALRKGDKVRLANGSYKPIVWLQRLSLDEAFLETCPDANPILIRKGSLGPDLPLSDVVVSPRQMVNARRVAGATFPREAAQMTIRAGVSRMRETGLRYTLFHVGEPAEVRCEGLLLSIDPPEGRWAED